LTQEAPGRPARLRLWRTLAVAAAMMAVVMRWTGIDRDVVDFVLPAHSQSGPAQSGQDVAFYCFHPDENSVVTGALAFDDPLNPPFTMYGALPFHLLRSTLAIRAWFDGAEPDQATIHRLG